MFEGMSPALMVHQVHTSKQRRVTCNQCIQSDTGRTMLFNVVILVGPLFDGPAACPVAALAGVLCRAGPV